MTQWISRSVDQIEAIKDVMTEFHIKHKLLEEHQVRARNRLRGKTLLQIDQILKEEWNGKGQAQAGKQDRT